MSKEKKLIRSYQQVLKGSQIEIFPLLCPVREKEWLINWDYNMIYSESGYAEKGCIFETNNIYGKYTWVITKHDIDAFEIQFVKTIKTKLAVIIDINLKESDKNTTICNIQYTFIALKEDVLNYIHKENSLENFNKHMKKWEDSLNYYLKHGKMLMK